MRGAEQVVTVVGVLGSDRPFGPQGDAVRVGVDPRRGPGGDVPQGYGRRVLLLPMAVHPQRGVVAHEPRAVDAFLDLVAGRAVHHRPFGPVRAGPAARHPAPVKRDFPDLGEPREVGDGGRGVVAPGNPGRRKDRHAVTAVASARIVDMASSSDCSGPDLCALPASAPRCTGGRGDGPSPGERSPRSPRTSSCGSSHSPRTPPRRPAHGLGRSVDAQGSRATTIDCLGSGWRLSCRPQVRRRRYRMGTADRQAGARLLGAERHWAAGGQRGSIGVKECGDRRPLEVGAMALGLSTMAAAAGLLLVFSAGARRAVSSRPSPARRRCLSRCT